MNILTPDEIADVVAEARVAHIGVVADGEPHVTPLPYVPFGNGIASARSPEGGPMPLRGIRGLAVEITLVDDKTASWRSVVASGNSSVIDDSQEAAEAVQLLLQRYAESFESLLGDKGATLGRASVVRIDFDEVAGRGSDGHLQRRTRPGRL